MKTGTALLAMGLLLAACNALAAVRYVNAASLSPNSPYTDWATAAATIQDAIDAAADGDEIVVTNGVYATGGRPATGYALTNRVTVDKPLTLRSVNGPEMTVIRGFRLFGPINGDVAVRCVYLTNGAALMGFTLTNGATRGRGDERELSGGGVLCESASAVVSNCTLVGNAALWYGGAAYSGTLNNCTLKGNSALFYGGGAYSSTLNDCTLTSNSAEHGGGASHSTLNQCALAGNWANSVYPSGGGAYSCALNNCTLSGNSAISTDGVGDGGGAFGGTLSNCTIRTNSADFGGGAAGGTLNNCTLTSNSAQADGGAVDDGVLSNCTLTGNSAGSYGGGACAGTLNNCALVGNVANFGGGAFESTLNNCTLTGNSASLGGGASACTLNNCIVYSNRAALEKNYYGGTLNFCCTTRLPPGGIGNFTNAPLFVNVPGGDLRLQSNSPCINAGGNSSAFGGTDLDGNPRIVGDTVDIGAYEFQSPQSVISYAWLQQYGLPIDGTADFTDSNGDGLNNWQEWRCGTDPTNAVSVLRLLTPSFDSTNWIVSWQSVPERSYSLERSTNLSASPLFVPVAQSIPGQSGTTTFTDTNSTAPGPAIYRVRVEE